MNALNEFIEAGLPINWRTLLLGLDGPGKNPPVLNLQDVREYAAECLAASDSREEVIAIATAADDDGEQVRAKLVTLTNQEQSDFARELRKWQIILLIRLLDDLPKDPLYGLLALTEFWAQFDFPSDGPQMVGRSGTVNYSPENFEKLVENHKAWLATQLRACSAELS